MFCHLLAARRRMAWTNLRQLFSVKTRDRTLVRRRSSTKLRSIRSVVRTSFRSRQGRLRWARRPSRSSARILHNPGSCLAEFSEELLYGFLPGLQVRSVPYHHKTGLDVVPLVGWVLGGEVGLAVYPIATAEAVRPHLIDGLDQPRRAIVGDGQRLRQPASVQVSDELQPAIPVAGNRHSWISAPIAEDQRIPLSSRSQTCPTQTSQAPSGRTRGFRR